MSRGRTALAWARRPLLAALAGSIIGINSAAAQSPGADAPELAPPLAAVTPLPVAQAQNNPPVLTPPTAQPPAVQPPAAGAAPQAVVPPKSGAAASQLVMPPIIVGTVPPGASAPCADGHCQPACDPCAFDWLNVPWVTPTPRIGGFIIPPPCGYFTLADRLNGETGAQPRQPYGNFGLNSTPFFDYDFRYLDADNANADEGSPFKRLHLGNNDNWLVSTGGEFRFRYVEERNSRGLGVNNDGYLLRGRAYADVWFKDDFRVFVEGIYAQTFNQNVPQLATDATTTDLLNAFVEARVGCLLDSPLYIRAGRQELLYGSQRLVSTNDWQNARRTFQGVKAYWHGEDLSVDAFWVQPVVPNADNFDSVNTDQNFFGVWTTLRPKPGTTLDLYYLGLTTANAPGAGDVETLGGRYAGDVCGRFLYDAEGAVQFGERDGRHVFAQMATGGLGYRFVNLPWNAQAWAYYDYASGDKDATGPSDRTFNQLFPNGHAYLGYLDLVGRQNIHDLNFQFTYNPQPWITSITQFHIFKLDARTDALYDAYGTAIRRDPTGAAGDDVGQEVDVATNFHLTPHSDLLVGYSKLYAGDFWKRTGPSGNPDMLYAQYSLRW